MREEEDRRTGKTKIDRMEEGEEEQDDGEEEQGERERENRWRKKRSRGRKPGRAKGRSGHETDKERDEWGTETLGNIEDDERE